MPLPDQVSLLCRAISEKGQKETEEILSRAREQADRILEQATDDSRRGLEILLTRERESARQRARQTIEAAELKARQRLLVAKEALLRELLKEGEKGLLALRDGPEYPGILMSLAVRAVSDLPDGHSWLQISEGDRALLTGTVLRDIAEQSGRKVELLQEPAKILGGCLSYSSDKRLLVDFSFGALLKRAEPRLKKLLASEFLNKAER